MASIEHTLYNFSGRPESLVEYFDSSMFDELIEMDLVNNRFRNLCHVEGKFYVPVFDGTFQDLYHYSGDNMVHPDDQAVHDALMDKETIFERLAASETPGVIGAEIRYRLQNGGYHWTREVVVGGPEHDIPDGIIRVYIYDIQIQKDRELGTVGSNEADAAATRDELTGMPREKEFIGAVSRLLDEGDCRHFCMVNLDVKQFKLFNEWYGREAGDFVLAGIGSYLCRRESEDGLVCGYLGQDDFFVFMPYDPRDVQRLYDDVYDAIANYGATMTFYPVLGVCLVEDNSTVYELMDHAMLATNSARNDIKHHIRLFEIEMHERTEAEFRLLTEFQQAMANGDICFVLQPQCRISTGQIIGCEALARWHKGDGEIFQPNDFIPVLEKFGFIPDLDRYIWEMVCACVKDWIGKGLEYVPVSVNVSRQDIYEFDVAEYFEKLLRKYDLPPSLIKIEITESAYIDDSNKVGDTVRKLREKGFLVLMDDFGSGYSSLNTLDSLSVDVIKLDMLFMRMDDEGKRKSIRIIESMVNMAQMLDLSVIAEGVEEKEQADFLHSLGCRYVQGFYFYKPMYPDEFEKLIRDTNMVDTDGFSIIPNEEFRTRELLDQNVYSNSMLNSILGALAVFSWHEDDVDVIRFNEQFYEETGIANLHEHLKGTQRYVDKKDQVRYYNLLFDAMEDELNGASDIIRFRMLDETPIDALMHFNYIGEVDGTKRFYGSVHNVTQLTELREQQQLISAITKISVSFLRKHKDGWHFSVGVHGIKDIIGLTREDLQRELDDRTWFDRLNPDAASKFMHLMTDGNNPTEDFEMPIEITTVWNTKVVMDLKCYCVKDKKSTFAYILVLS